MTPQEIKQQAHKEFDKEFNGVLEVKFTNEDTRIPPITRFVGYEIKSFMDSLIDRTVQMTEERVVEMIREYAEPYDGAIWLNEVNAQKIINLITNK